MQKLATWNNTIFFFNTELFQLHIISVRIHGKTKFNPRIIIVEKKIRISGKKVNKKFISIDENCCYYY